MREPSQFVRVSLISLLALNAATPALAAPLDVTGSLTAPVATSTAASNAPGDITIETAGSIVVSSGVPVTIDSSNLLTNNGTVSSTAASNATAILVNGASPIAMSLVDNGTVNVSGTGGAGNTGLLIANGPVTGTISSTTLSSITVTGDNALGVSVAAPFTGTIGVRAVSVTGANSTAISLTAPLTGSLSLAGINSSTGAGGYGLLLAAPVSGTVGNAGSLTVGTVRTTDASGNLVAGVLGTAGARISASVGAGFVNDRYYVDANNVVVPAALVNTTVDTLITGAIYATGTAPALWVAPAATSPQAISLGVAGAGDDAYAIVNRGVLQTSIAAAGQSTVALLVGGGGASTTLAGGINSQVNASVNASSVDGSATAVDLRAGAIVPQFRNQGAVNTATILTAASGSTPAGPGGRAYGILVEPGASLPSLVNTGTFNIAASGPGNGATAILDQSGTLASIVNSGAITVTASDPAASLRAIDLSGSTAAVTVANTGTITGSIVFGNGASTLAAGGGTISGAIVFGSGANLLAASGNAVVNTPITSTGPLALTLADSASVSLVKGSSILSSVSASGGSTLVVPVGQSTPLVVTGTASFTGTSTVQLALQSLLLNQNIVILQANGGLTTDHLPTLVDATSAPFLFTAAPAALTDTTLGVTLTRKSAGDLGLAGGQAALFNASIGALANAPLESGAIANLTTQAAVASAYRQITPPSFGSAPLRTAETFADIGFGAAGQRLSVVDDLRRSGAKGIGVWGQEVGDFTRQSAGANDLGFKANTFGLAGGIDTPLLGLDAVGIAVLSNWASVDLNSTPGSPTVPVTITTQGVAPYVSWSWKQFFIQGTALAARVTYDSSRLLTIGSFSDTVNAHWTGTQFGTGLTIGGKFKFGRISVTPSNALYWTSLTQNAYVEQGGGAFALDVSKQKNSALTDTGRLSIAYTLPLGDGAAQAELHGGYQHQFHDNPSQTVAQFISASDAITLPADMEKADKLTYGASVGYLQENLRVSLGYDRKQSTGLHDQQIALIAGFAF